MRSADLYVLINLGYNYGFNLGAIPNDFRRFVSTNNFATKVFRYLIESFYENTGKPVIIIAHSFGNLITLNNLISKENQDLIPKIKKFISIGAPFAGSTELLNAYLHNYDAFDTGHSSTSISAAMGIARARDLEGKKNEVVAIIGDGGIVIMDTDRNMLMVSNEGRNIATVDKDEKQYTYEDGSAGIDDINAGDGDNVVFGGLNNDDITTGKGKDVVFGDNGYATFRGNANEAWYKGYDETRPRFTKNLR